MTDQAATVTVEFQTALPLFAMKPEATDDQAAFLVKWLREHRGWHLAGEILAAWSMKDSDQTRRFLRKLAEESNGEVISGQAGYKWIGHATAEEVNHAANWLERQASLMGSRAGAIRRKAHELFG